MFVGGAAEAAEDFGFYGEGFVEWQGVAAFYGFQDSGGSEG